PGTYQVKLTVGSASKTAPLELRADPRVKASAEDLRKQFELASKVKTALTDLPRAVNQIRDLRAQMLVMRRRAGDGASSAPLVAAADDLEKKMASIEQELIQVKLKSSEGTLAFPTMLNEQLYYLAYAIETADAAPTKPLYEAFELLAGKLDAALARWKGVL